jgi:hypothetical protein
MVYDPFVWIVIVAVGSSRIDPACTTWPGDSTFRATTGEPGPATAGPSKRSVPRFRTVPPPSI